MSNLYIGTNSFKSFMRLINDQFKSINHNHTYREHVDYEANCDTEGVKSYSCDCGNSYRIMTPATGHNFVDNICTKCGAVHVHSYDSNGVCTECGFKANVGVSSELVMNWSYRTDDEEKTVTLLQCMNRSENVIVRAAYMVNDEVYRTIVSPTYVSGSTERHLFYNNTNVINVSFEEGIDYSLCDDISNMFKGMTKLQTVDLTYFNPSNITQCFSLFIQCSSLTSVDISMLDFSKVSYFSGLFTDCSSLTSVNLGSVITGNTDDLSYLFDGCTALTSVDLSKCDTSNVKKVQYMFRNCKAMKEIKVKTGTFEVSQFTNRTSYLQSCACQTFTYVD